MNRSAVDLRLDERRRFLQAIAAGASVTMIGCAGQRSTRDEEPMPHDDDHDEHDEAEVTPGEDLMQEHGIVERALLVYEEAALRIERGAAIEFNHVTSTAAIVRRFVEDYHERMEEDFVFPRLEAARSELELVATLRRQHEKGREATEAIRRAAAASSPDPAELRRLLRGFSRMYRPHASREDTVLFPAFRRLLDRTEYAELGEQFEEREHALFGEDGFSATVAEVAAIEKSLGIFDLSAFTME